ncbi:hypothetical protein CLV62_12647 [Dysgonomonas alginatilytica]|uniref:Uncharacterized protein n=1 Tax=Dysgonomonas alginatilytica TaxID=1605892 RepID=A0A2V3PJW3_9BACT|nr:hypothetical protein CLV62_12647 [Dysgonomonas alginatilytica]
MKYLMIVLIIIGVLISLALLIPDMLVEIIHSWCKNTLEK